MRKITILCLLLLLYPTMGFSQMGALTTVVLAERAVPEILNDFENTADRLMDGGQQTGNALASKLGNEIRIATLNLNYLMDEQRKRTFNQLDPKVRDIFHNLNKLIENFDPDKIYKVTELFALNIQEFLGPLLADKRDFYLSSVKGITVYQKESDFILRIRGIGFGFNDSKHKYSVSLSVKDEVIEPKAFQRPDNHELVITIPNKLVMPYFEQTKVVHLPITFSSTVKKKKPFWKFGGWTEDSYNIDFNLVLLPIEAGEIEVKETITTRVIDEDQGEKHYPLTWDPPGCPDKCTWEERYTVAENQIITRVVYSHNDVAHCNWSYSTKGGRGADYDIYNGNKSVVCRREYDHEDPGCRIRYDVYFKTFKDEPKTIVNGTYKLQWGKKLIISFNEKNLNGNFEISGKTITRDAIELTSASVSSPVGPLEYKGTGEFGAGRYKAEFYLSVE
ncbi:MAG: hypothetical protein KDI38_22220 [Calditrichaeota bacterium]|nr:hypothetical protein [Calditrichota bacterium]